MCEWTHERVNERMRKREPLFKASAHTIIGAGNRNARVTREKKINKTGYAQLTWIMGGEHHIIHWTCCVIQLSWAQHDVSPVILVHVCMSGRYKERGREWERKRGGRVERERETYSNMTTTPCLVLYMTKTNFNNVACKAGVEWRVGHITKFVTGKAMENIL